MPIVAIGGPPPPKDSFGHERPPPRPPKPRLKPVIVSPHCTLPRSEVQVCWTRLQIFGGTIAGELDSPLWTQRTAGGVEVGRVDNPVLQNQAHVRAVEGFLGDLRVPICGYVVSAGRARFAPEIADAVIPVGDLSWVLSISFAEPNPRVLDAA
jgi:hypothetical protein